MKNKMKSEKELMKNLTKAHALLEPYVEMLCSFIEEEESGEIDQRIEEWIFCASTVLAHDLSIKIEDIFPQNIASTMAKMGLIDSEEFNKEMAVSF